MDDKRIFNKRNVIFIIIVVFIMIIVNLVFMFLIKNNVDDNLQNENTETKVDYNIKYNGYSFTIPLTLQHEIDNGTFIISNKVNKWDAILYIVPKDYENIYKQRDKISETLNSKEIEINEVSEDTYSGTTYLIFEISNDTLLAISNLSGGNSIMFIITNEDEKYNYDALVELASVVKNASYFGESNKLIKDKFNEEDIINSIMG